VKSQSLKECTSLLIHALDEEYTSSIKIYFNYTVKYYIVVTEQYMFLGTLIRNLPSIVCINFSDSTRFDYSARTSTLSLVKVKHRTRVEVSGPCIAITDVVLMYTSIIYTYIYIYIHTYIYILGGGDSPQWARASSFTRFLDHTQRRITVGRTPLDE
jgi:hypothetical protein